MPTINPSFDTTVANIPKLTWEGIVDGDTITGKVVPGKSGLAGAVQFAGTFDGATASLQYSNDGVTYLEMDDVVGASISSTADAIFEFSTAAMYLKPAIATATENTVIDVIVVLRG